MKSRLCAISFSIPILAAVLAVLATFWFASATRAGVIEDLSGLDAPTLTAISPSTAPNDLDTPLIITGTGFAPGLTVTIGSAALADSAWVSETRGTATLPWGLEPGVYSLTVQNPGGETAILPNAFTVTQGIGVWNSGELYGGWVDQTVIDPFDPQIVYAVAGGVGFFRSLDGGQNWNILRPGVGTSALSTSPALQGRLYMQGTWELRRSDDRGETWTLLSPTFPVANTAAETCGGYRTLPHPALANTVYASLCSAYTPAPNGLLRSDDGGQNWAQKMEGLTDTQVTALAFHPTNPLTMYLGTASGRLYVSSDGGEEWQYASRPLGYIESIAVDPFGAHSVWVNSIHGRDSLCKTYYSVDQSLTNWVEVNPSGLEHFCRKVIFDPVNPGTIYIPFGFGFKTTNGGQDWIEFDLGVENYPIDIAVDPLTPDTLYMSDGARAVYKSLNGGETWQESNAGLSAMIPVIIETLPAQPDTIFALFSNGLFRGSRGGASWQKVAPDWMSAVWDFVADPFIPQRLYVGSLAGMCITMDTGETFTGCVQLEAPAAYAGHGIWPQVMEADPVHPGTLLVGVRYITGTNFLDEGALYRTTDYGASWNIITSTIGVRLPHFIIFDPLSPTIAYMMTAGGGPLRSPDSGLTWERIATDVPALQAGGVLAIEPVPPGRIFTFGSDSGLWFSEDHGDTWANLPYTGLGINVAALLWLPGDPPVLYGATPTGLSRSLDRGATWERMPGVLGYANVNALDAVQVDERTILYAGIVGGSLETCHSISGNLWASGEAFTGAASGFAGQTMLGAGVYRYTAVKAPPTLYLPLVSR
jgi:photosystem II stability/assembly factor-like uncharacterized protein